MTDRRKERRNIETLTRRADFLDARIGGVVGDHTDRDRQELRALRWALDRLAATPAPEADPMYVFPFHPDDGHGHVWGCRRCGIDPFATPAPEAAPRE